VFVGNDAERRIPAIEPFDGDRTLPEGERLKLICKASGSPRPVLSWYRSGRLLEGTEATDDDPHDESLRHSRYQSRRLRAYDAIYYSVDVNRKYCQTKLRFACSQLCRAIVT